MAVISIVTVAAVLLLALVLAYWTWAWLAPHPEPRAQEAVPADSRPELARGLFGSTLRSGKSGVPNGIVPTGIAIKLLGVVAATGGRPAYAVMQLDARQILAVRAGNDVAPGVRLAEVHAQGVILDRNGLRETLTWPERNTAVNPIAPAAGK